MPSSPSVAWRALVREAVASGEIDASFWLGKTELIPHECPGRGELQSFHVQLAHGPDREQGYVTAPRYQAAVWHGRRDRIAAVPVGQRGQVQDLEVNRREGRADGSVLREIAERQRSLAQLGMLQKPSPRWPVTRGYVRVTLREAVDERGEVEPSITLDLDVQIETVDLHVGECPRPAKETRQLEVDQQAAKRDDRLARRVLEAEAVHLQTQEERIDTDVPTGRVASELVSRIPRAHSARADRAPTGNPPAHRAAAPPSHPEVFCGWCCAGGIAS